MTSLPVHDSILFERLFYAVDNSKRGILMIRIIVDSSSDYQLEELKQKNMELVPISITMGDQSYLDGIDLNRDDFYKMLTETTDFPKTSQPSTQSFLDIFLDAKEKGDDCICILLSSGLSGTYQGACLARNLADYDNIYIIDSLAAICIIQVLAERACALREQGYNASDIVSEVEKLKSRVKLVAALDTLEYLRRGGRLSKTAATIGELANLKPMITITEEGTIGVIGKSLGRNKAISGLIKHVKENELDLSYPVYSLYTFGTDNSEIFEEKLANEDIYPTARLQVGPTIGTHIGPNAFGIMYVIKE